MGKGRSPKSGEKSQDKMADATRLSKTCCDYCSAAAETQCTGCRSVYYCSRACQRKDWTSHKALCRPYSIVCTDRGKNLVASRDLDTDDVIVSERPLVLGPKQITEPLCLGCYKKVNGNYMCSRCSWPLCSEACGSKQDHEPECQLTSTSGVRICVDSYEGPQRIYESVTLLRCLYTAASDPKRWKHCLQRFDHRYAKLRGSPQYEQNQIVVDFVRQTVGLTNRSVDTSEATIHAVLGLLQLNSVPTKTPYAEVQGLYPVISLVSHSCLPNTKSTWEPEEGKLTLRASEPIKRGQPLTGLYTDILLGTRARRQYLQQTKLISCTCQRCVDSSEMATNFSTLRCPKCPTPFAVLPVNPLDDDSHWACHSCGHQMEVSAVQSLTLALGAAVEEALLHPDIESLEKLQNDWVKKVHPNHYHLHAVKHTLLQLYGRSKDRHGANDEKHWEEIAKKEKACKEFLTVCSRLDPSTAHTIPYVGLAFFEYHKTILQNAKRNFSQAKINAAQLKKRMLLAKALLRKSMEIFKNEAEDTPEGQLYLSCQQEIIAIGKWMLAVGLV